MVHLVSTSSGFEAKVVAARLGAEGIVWGLRGSVDSLYPVGGVEVLVSRADSGRARELLLADEVESAFDDEAEVASTRPADWVVLVVGGLLLVVFVAFRVMSLV